MFLFQFLGQLSILVFHVSLRTRVPYSFGIHCGDLFLDYESIAKGDSSSNKT